MLAGLARYGVLLAGEDGTIAYCSAAAGAALGDDGVASLRNAWPGLLARRDGGSAAVHAALSVGGGDTRREVRVEVHPLAGGPAPYLVLVEALDGDAVTQLRLANQALTNAYLASALLHEINAPLNNVKLTLALCDASLARSGAGTVPAELRARLERYFKVVGDEASRLSHLLEELRHMSTSAGHVSEIFDLGGLAGDIVRLMRHEATIRQIRLAVQPAEGRLRARADRRVVLLALLGVVIHVVEQTAAEGVVSLSLHRVDAGEACFAVESTAADGAAATRSALDRVAGTLRREDIPLVAARAQIEALRGTVHVVEHQGRFGVEVRVPLVA